MRGGRSMTLFRHRPKCGTLGVTLWICLVGAAAGWALLAASGPGVSGEVEPESSAQTSGLSDPHSEPAEPVKPPESIKPTEDTGPTEPVQPSEPTEATEPVEPSEPIEPLAPSEPIEPIEPTGPTEPALPTEPAEPTEPIEPPEDAEPAEVPAEETLLKFNFRHAPWEDVLRWIAEQSNLSVSLDIVPTGTFNYADDARSFTCDQAIDLMNSILLIKGYTLVRRDKMLLVIDLEDEIDRHLVRELVTEIPLSELDTRGKYEITKTCFTLEKVDAKEAETQIRELLSPVGSLVVMPKVKQILATETGGRLRTMRDVIELLEKAAAADEKSLKTFTLSVATADEVLVVARPLLDVPADGNAAEDGSIRISADPLGRMVFATGTPEKIALLEQIVEQVDGDVASGEQGMAVEPPQFMSHAISSADPDAVLRVLQTLFVGDQVVRLEINRSTGGIVAFARPSQHRAIQATIAEMEQSSHRLEVIPLRSIDPASAVLLIDKMFSTSPSPPVVDATIEPPQVVVRGTPPQVELIHNLLEDMGERFDAGSPAAQGGGNLRMLPIDSASSRAALEQIQEIWPRLRSNRIRVVAPSQFPLLRTVRPRENPSGQAPGDASPPRPFGHPAGFGPPPGPVEEVPSEVEEAHPEDVETAPAGNGNGSQDTPADVFVTPARDRVVIYSDDLVALDALESLFDALTGPSGGGATFHLFYLRHVEADSASDLVSRILSGDSGGTNIASTAGASSRGTESRGGIVGTLLSGGGSTSGSPFAGGVPYIVADKRLNALFVQGTPPQIDTVEQLLEVIDIESGPVEVLTSPKPKFIPVYYARAEDVAEVVRDLYANRIETGSSGRRDPSASSDRFFPGGFRGPFGGGGSRDRDGRGSDRGQNTGGASGQLPKMTLGVDTRSNSIVVSAPGPLLTEVESVVREIDDRAMRDGPETVTVVTLERASPSMVQGALSSLLGSGVQTNRGQPTRTGERPGSGSPSPGSPTRPAIFTPGQAPRSPEALDLLRGRGDMGGRFGFPGARPGETGSRGRSSRDRDRSTPGGRPAGGR